MPPRDWHLITGEYPPQPGGVADYTALVASGLARAGQAVHVWTRGDSGATVETDGVTVHRVAGSFRAEGLRHLSAELDAMPAPRRLVVQYVPQSYGRSGTNVAFTRWVEARAWGGDAVWTMFHEVQYVWERGQPIRRFALHAISGRMARTVARASSRIYVTIPAWERRVRGFRPRAPIAWLPVPSTVPIVDDPGGVNAIRAGLGPNVTRVIGSFGTYPPWIRGQLRFAIPRLLDVDPGRRALILGRDSEILGREILSEHPELEGRMVATGLIETRSTSLHLQACDLLLLPYPDGVSTRRTTTMAALAHGRSVVTTTGHLSEPFWPNEEAVRIVPAGDAEALREAAEGLARHPEETARRGRAARELYESRFAVERTVQKLMEDAQADAT